MDVTPPALDAGPPPAEPRPRLGRRLLIGGLSFVLVAGLVGAGVVAFRFVRGAGDRLAGLAPDDTAAFATVYLDPAGSQKLAVNGLLSKFPEVSTSRALDAAVNRLLDTTLTESGLSHADVRPWLGTQLAAAVSSQAPGRDAAPAAAALFASSDDSKAAAALRKFENGAQGRRFTWKTSDDDGVSVDTGTRSAGESFVWCIVGGTVVISNSTSFTDEVIHTAHGKHATLAGTADYSAAEGQLPADKLAFVYVDIPKLAALNGAGKHTDASVSPLAGGLLPNLAAYHGAAFALSAQSDGVAVDGVVDFDMSKMTASQRAALQVGADINRTLSFVPQRAYGAYALTGLPQTIRSLLDTFGAGSNQGGGGGGFGDIAALFLKHLTGDAALEVDHGDAGRIPGVALLLAADSDDSAKQLASGLVQTACGFAGTCDRSAEQHQTYRGTTITTVALPDGDQLGVAPSWAVKDSMGIIASTPGEVKAVLDAHAGGSVTTADGFTNVVKHGDLNNNSLLYLDLASISAAVRDALPAAEGSRFDAEVAPYLDHFTSLLQTSVNGSDRTTFRMFVTVR